MNRFDCAVTFSAFILASVASVPVQAQVSSSEMSVAEMEEALGLKKASDGPRFRAPTFEVEGAGSSGAPTVAVSAPVRAAPQKAGYSFSLPIEFEFGSSEVTTAYRSTVDRIAELLRGNPALKLLIRGHTDAVGSSVANLELSRKRADGVKRALIGKGIAAERLEADGVGERALLDGQTPESAKNRRVEFIRVN
jgi:outer membrane protein OmpA-like peptidoglycan-associated protein